MYFEALVLMLHSGGSALCEEIALNRSRQPESTTYNISKGDCIYGPPIQHTRRSGDGKHEF